VRHAAGRPGKHDPFVVRLFKNVDAARAIILGSVPPLPWSLDEPRSNPARVRNQFENSFGRGIDPNRPIHEIRVFSDHAFSPADTPPFA
jgi:hypothetical protein